MKKIAFVDADKYVLADNYQDFAPFAPPHDIYTSYGAFYMSGQYEVSAGFLFSANWPAINTDDGKRAAMCHDFFYNLMKDEHLSRDYRADVDKLFYDMLIEDGMPSLRAWYWHKAVRVGGNAALDSPKPKKQYAPPEFTPQAGWQLNHLLNRKN